MEHFSKIGKIVYLQLSYEAICERLGDLHQRGVALRPEQTLKDLYEERIPLYEQYADLIENCEHHDIRTIVAELATKISE